MKSGLTSFGKLIRFKGLPRTHVMAIGEEEISSLVKMYDELEKEENSQKEVEPKGLVQE